QCTEDGDLLRGTITLDAPRMLRSAERVGDRRVGLGRVHVGTVRATRCERGQQERGRDDREWMTHGMPPIAAAIPGRAVSMIAGLAARRDQTMTAESRSAGVDGKST